MTIVEPLLFLQLHSFFATTRVCPILYYDVWLSARYKYICLDARNGLGVMLTMVTPLCGLKYPCTKKNTPVPNFAISQLTLKIPVVSSLLTSRIL